MKSRMRERRTYGSVRGLWREPLVYSTVGIYTYFLKINTIDEGDKDEY